MKDYPQAIADVIRRAWRGFLRALADWRWVGAMAVLMLVGSVGFALVVLVQDRDQAIEDRNELQSIVEAGDAVTRCRSKVAAGVTDAQVDNDLAENQLVVELARSDGADRRAVIAAAITNLDHTGDTLDEARDARNAFEASPTGDC